MIKHIFFGILLWFLTSGCTREQNEVVVYTSVDQVFSEPVLKDFEKETGINVRAVFDTEETKSTGVLNRIIAEKENPRCDVFWSGDPVRTIILKNKDLLTQYNSPQAVDIDNVFKDSDHYWTGFSARARVLIYNKKLVAGKEVPHSIYDLINPVYEGSFAIANPLFGTTTFHIAALFSYLGDKKAEELLNGLKNNGLVFATSNGDVKKRVMNGELFCGLTDTDDAFEARKENGNTAFIFLDQKGMGTLIMPNTVCLIKGSPNQDNGKKLIDYLLSKETEKKLARSCAQMPLHKGVKLPSGVPSLDNIVPMNIDYEKVAKKLEDIQQFLKEWTETH